jgi:hypothetical protein
MSRILLQPKKVSIPLSDGTEKIFVISKFPAIAGREIIYKYPTSALPKLGEYATNEEIMLKIMSYVAAMSENMEVQLSTRGLVDSHVDSWETLLKIEIAIMEYNCSFFANGSFSNWVSGLFQKLPQFLTKILMSSLESLSQTTKQNSTNSEQSTL